LERRFGVPLDARRAYINSGKLNCPTLWVGGFRLTKFQRLRLYSLGNYSMGIHLHIMEYLRAVFADLWLYRILGVKDWLFCQFGVFGSGKHWQIVISCSHRPLSYCRIDCIVVIE
jgi:hypothetical protein